MQIQVREGVEGHASTANVLHERLFVEHVQLGTRCNDGWSIADGRDLRRTGLAVSRVRQRHAHAFMMHDQADRQRMHVDADSAVEREPTYSPVPGACTNAVV